MPLALLALSAAPDQLVLPALLASLALLASPALLVPLDLPALPALLALLAPPVTPALPVPLGPSELLLRSLWDSSPLENLTLLRKSPIQEHHKTQFLIS